MLLFRVQYFANAMTYLTMGVRWIWRIENLNSQLLNLIMLTRMDLLNDSYGSHSKKGRIGAT